MSSHHRDSQQQKQPRVNSQTNSRATGGLYRASTHSQLHASQQQHQPGSNGLEFEDDTTDQLSPPHNRDFEGRNLQINYAEELENTEQSITLCLQEIDRNFAHAQRIIASAIVPVVEQYGRESRKASDGARFWKSFLETSANVSLSGYEEIAINEGAAAEISQQQEQMDEGVPVHYNDEYSQLEQSEVAENEGNDEVGSDNNEINNVQNFNEDDVFTTAPGGSSARRGKEDSSELPDPPSTRLFASRPHKHPHHSGRAPTAGVFKQPAPPHARLDFGDMTPTAAAAAAAGLAREDTVSSVASSPFNSNILPQDESLSFAGVLGATPARSRNNNNNNNNNDKNDNNNNNDDDNNNTDSIASPIVTRHTVLDKNWRIQMTPHKKKPVASSYSSSKHHAASAAATKTQTPHRIRGFREQVEFKKQSFAARFDSSPLDGLEPPQLHTDLSSPTPRKKQNTGATINFGPAIYATPRQRRRPSGTGPGVEAADHIHFTNNGPKTPIQRFYEEAAAAGDSSFGSEGSPVHTPSNPSRTTPAAPGGGGGGGTAVAHDAGTDRAGARGYNNTFQDDDTSLMGLPEGMSPPVTMQFTMPSDVPQRTPAREAAQSIVQDILRSAGANDYDLDLDQPE
ncbi:hypothetical protein D0Z00_000720 [Geotrichum galactomycetum]|uniref:Uncharacterized protein n=1 Tax=Geotrichum galactomycetum TaxID=27317 RepID=A0ACB6V9A6_9ASCO|nr:hypothetical protein D0Z00_000720 [Geotrichum candidum]